MNNSASLASACRHTDKSWAYYALESALRYGADFCDIRITTIKNEQIRTRENRVKDLHDHTSRGIGIRASYKGAWGFCACSDLSKSAIEHAAKQAVEFARQRQLLPVQTKNPIFAPVIKADWSTPITKATTNVPLQEKIEFLLGLNAKALQLGARFCDSFLWSVNEQKFFVSSHGSEIYQDIHRIWCEAAPTVVDDKNGTFETGATKAAPSGSGFESIEAHSFDTDLQHAVECSVMKLKAPSVTPGPTTLIIDPSNLWLTIHETCGHASELDRALGLEADYAGTSFLTPDKLGTLHYGSPLVTIVADRSQQGGLATCAFDDEGIPSSQFPIIKDGVFTNYQRSLGTAFAQNPHFSNGCAYADSWNRVALARMPNISLMPGTQALSLQNLIKDTEEGIYIVGDKSWSIDQQRYNFQFTGQEFWHIKAGKIVGMLRDVAYQGNTVQFWNSCDAICDASEYKLGGSFFCGKGQPAQLAPVSHGSAPARFRNIQVINTAESK